MPEASPGRTRASDIGGVGLVRFLDVVDQPEFDEFEGFDGQSVAGEGGEFPT